VPSSEKLPAATDAAVVAITRGLAMDAPLAAKSGHQGTAMALAPLAHVLYSRILRHHPGDSSWRNRDRFILSGGHASKSPTYKHFDNLGLKHLDIPKSDTHLASK